MEATAGKPNGVPASTDLPAAIPTPPAPAAPVPDNPSESYALNKMEQGMARGLAARQRLAEVAFNLEMKGVAEDDQVLGDAMAERLGIDRTRIGPELTIDHSDMRLKRRPVAPGMPVPPPPKSPDAEPAGGT